MRELVRRTSLTLAALALIVPLSLGTASAAGTTSPAVSPASQATTVIQSDKIGMNGGGPLLWEPPAELAKDLDAARAAGAGWIRLDIDWSQIQDGGPWSFDWSNADRVVNAARAHGLQVLGLTTYSPRWAQDASVPAGETHGRPASPNTFATFAGQAAAHFAGRITTWEIWNEPNLATFFSPRVDVPFYTAMLRASYAAIHAAVPDATVLSGGLAPATDTYNLSSVSPVTFLNQMYANGAANTMDGVAVHPYSYPALPSDPATANWNTFYRLRIMHDTMVAHGDGAKKMWLTEFGAPTGPGGNAVSEQRQADIISDGLAQARALSYAGPVFVYNIRDFATGSSDTEDNFGLLHTDRSVKAAYTVVQQAAAGLSMPVVTSADAAVANTVADWWGWLLGLLKQWLGWS